MRLNVVANFLLLSCFVPIFASVAGPFSYRIVPYAVLFGIAVQLFHIELPLRSSKLRHKQ